MNKMLYYSISFVLSIILVFSNFSTFSYAASSADPTNSLRSAKSNIDELGAHTIHYTQDVKFNINERSDSAKEVVLVLDTSSSLQADLDSPLFDYNLLSGGTDDLKIEKKANIMGKIHSNAGFISNNNTSTIGGTCYAVKKINISKALLEPKKVEGTTRISMLDFSDKILAEINADSTHKTLAASSIATSPSFTVPTIINGNVTFSGNVNINSKVYVNGDVTINASSYKGLGILVAKGKISIQGNSFQINEPSDSNSLGLYSVNNDIVFESKTLNYIGVCYAPKGSIVFNNAKDPRFTGYMAANRIQINVDNFSDVTGAAKLQKALKSYVKSTRLQVLRNAASAFIEKFRGKNIKLSVIRFSQTADLTWEGKEFNKFEFFDMSKDSKVDELKKWVTSLNTVQGTNIGDGFRRAHYLLTDSSKSNASAEKFVVLMTDGEPDAYSINKPTPGGSAPDFKTDATDTATSIFNWRDASELKYSLEYAQRMGTLLHNDNITSYVIGFTSASTDDKLKAMADACASNPVDSSGQNYYKALTSDAIHNVYDSIATDIIGGVKFSARFTELLPAEVKSVSFTNENLSYRKIEKSDIGTTINTIKIKEDDVGKYLVDGNFDLDVTEVGSDLYTINPNQNFDITVKYKYSAFSVKYSPNSSVITYTVKCTSGDDVITTLNFPHYYNGLKVDIKHFIDIN